MLCRNGGNEGTRGDSSINTLDVNEILTDILFTEITDNYAELYDRCLITAIDQFFQEVGKVFVRFGADMGILS